MAKNAVITGWGFYAPSRVLTNADLERIVDTSDEWITSRTGIKERRIASDGETTSTMSIRAARQALEKAHLRGQDVQLVIVGTASPDYLFPATACLVQAEIGATRAGAFDVEAACTSFISALAIARGMIVSGAIENALIIEGVAKRLRFPSEKVFVNIQRYGNTSAASVPIAICEAEATGRLRKGDKVLLVAFGGGFTWGASVLEWFGAHDGVRPLSRLERAGRALEDVVERVRPI